MKKLVLLSILTVLCTCPVVRASELDSKMDSIAKQFSRDAGAMIPSLADSTLAVFPYSCEEKLAKKRVDLAVGELLTNRLIRTSAFKLVERAQLETVLKEQKLGLSGAIESKTAAEIGKLTGAKLSVLGTVTKVGNSYQISSKLVDAETAEIISASIVEVPVSVFDEEAARYLTLVPDREALGIYAAFSYWPIKGKSLPPVTLTAMGNAVVTPVQKNGTYFALGVGLKYQVTPRLLLDIAVLPASGLGTLVDYTITNPTTRTNPGTMDGMGARVSLSRTSALSNRFRAIYGIGYQVHDWSFFSESTPKEVFTTGNKQLRLPNGSADLYGAFLRGSLEWRAKERFGWTISGQLNQPGTINCELNVQQADTVLQKVKVMEAAFPFFFAETSFSFYF